MRLVIGGACQGKLAYAKDSYGISDGWVDGRSCSREDLNVCRGIHHFHEYIRRMISGDGSDLWTGELTEVESKAEDFVRELLQKNPDIVIVSNELGYGLVPIEKQDRLWRETVGRICICLAREADEVVRVVCGMGMKIKS